MKTRIEVTLMNGTETTYPDVYYHDIDNDCLVIESPENTAVYYPLRNILKYRILEQK